ncbi:patatin-like phospholipase family protein [Bacillus badius]|uniref:patatin-like phospholipase family protein n=1 Tax=Bacillus badius TaxID=1455 RepID=UPI0007B0591D|nr:patatin-like phospholipase family protein [Bacillus badius]KZO01568.1 esterase [Bacillus badius]MED0667215.1 patatin-like phospholipase family protein [Bacillus badius]OCS89962.1 esterase [Bacillus badius]OVE53489.1 esterase [Bacillus badius]TDW05849.1 NTE family protein [Bacillus badius]
MARPKIGVALGAGGARGFAHIGALKALKKADIPIDMIAGSSMGSFVASLYGTGHDMEQLHKLSTAFRRKYFLDFMIPKMGFIAGKKIKNFIRLFTHGKNIEDLNIPIAIVATDIKNAEKVVFKNGPVADAVRASIAIPGIFVPEKIDGRLLVDGGVIDRVPVSVVKEMGADIIIGVDVSSVKTNVEIQTIFDVIMQSIDILQMEIIANRQTASHVMIRPPVEMYSSKAFTCIDEIIIAGEEETERRIPEIIAEMDDWKEQPHEK